MSARCLEVSRTELDLEKQMGETVEWLKTKMI
jgi:hypothetical protein